jgi:CRP-like cAMP-binding protein
MDHGRLTPIDVRALRRAPMFRGYDEDSFTALIEVSQCCELQPGETIFEEDTPCRAFFFVLEGFVQLSRREPSGKPRVVEFIEPGETFAEAAMFSGRGYPVTAVVMAETRLVEINAYRFMRLLRTRPQISWTMLAELSMRLHQLVSHIATSSLHGAEQKVAAYLLDHCDHEAEVLAVSHLPNRRKELASRLGISTESLCRVLGTFRDRGWISTRDSTRIEVLAEGELKALLQDGGNGASGAKRRALKPS